MVTGLVTTTATAPVDVIKTHMFVGMLCVSSYTVHVVLIVSCLPLHKMHCSVIVACPCCMVNPMLHTRCPLAHCTLLHSKRQRILRLEGLTSHLRAAYLIPASLHGPSDDNFDSSPSMLLWSSASFTASHISVSCVAFWCAGGNHYTGPLQCAQDIVKREGARGLLRGWTAQYVRLGPQTTVIFVVMEELRKLNGLGAL